MVRIIALILVCASVIACGEQEQYPKPATIHLTGVQIGTGLHPVMERVNRLCRFPGEVIKGPDGDYYMLEHGDEVEILEQDSGCTAPKGGASKVRAVETGLVGWLQTSELREE